MSQFFFYKLLFPPRPRSLIPPNFHSQLQHRVISPQSTSTPVTIHRTVPSRGFQRSVVSIAILLGFVSAATATPVEDVPNNTDTMERLGEMFAWICCSFYLSSRIPQILENHRRKSTQGINIVLFLAALCGNFFYTIGILTNPLAHNKLARRDFLLNALPYLLGSAGFDSIIIST
jgi:solute carrier family 66 (lysosomal lysine-arginine transporter), member 1